MSLAHRLIIVVVLASIVAACASGEDAEENGAATTSSPEATTPSTIGSTTSVPPSDLLSAIRGRGRLLCGVDGALPGFSAPDASGEPSGFDVDMCRAVATAVLGAREALRFIEVPAGEAAGAIEAGEVDLVSSQTGWSGDSTSPGPGAAAGPIVFFDGLQLMGRAVDGYTPDSALAVVAGDRVCVAGGVAEAVDQSLADESIDVALQPEESAASALEAFKSGDCDLVAAHTTELVAAKTAEPEGAGWVVFPVEALDPRPVSLGHRAGDDAFATVLDVVVAALMDAETRDVTSESVVDLDEVPAFLEVPAEAEDQLGLASNALVQVIRQVGNYGEVFERHLGAVGLERGVNALVRDGGLLESPR